MRGTQRLVVMLAVASVFGLAVWRVPPHGVAVVNETSRPLVLNEVVFDGQTRRPAVSLVPGERVSMRFRKQDRREAGYVLVVSDDTGSHRLDDCGYVDHLPTQYVAVIHEGPTVSCDQWSFADIGE